MTARDDVLTAAQSLVASSDDGTFSVQDIVDYLRRLNSTYAESTIRTHVVSRMCTNAAKHHAVTYDDLIKVGPGKYRLNR